MKLPPLSSSCQCNPSLPQIPLALQACDDDDAFLVCKWNGKPLTKEHGAPVRVIVPKRYAWKGAKWVKEITFSEHDQKGFWEVRGYSNTALPWQDDRYG